MLRKFAVTIVFGIVMGPAAVALAESAQGELPVALIDQLMRKQAGEKSITAEGALPTTHVVSTEKLFKDEPNVKAEAVEESQPVFKDAGTLNKTEKGPSSTSLWGRMFGSLAVVLIMLGGAVYGLKKWPGAKKLGVKNKMIDVISQHYLGPKKSLAVVRVAGETVLIGVTDNNISILKTLALLDDDIPKEDAIAATMSAGIDTFSSTLRSKVSGEAAGANPPVVYGKSGRVRVPEEGDEEFAMRGLRDIIDQKLKTMKEL